MTHLLLWRNAYAQIIRNGKGEAVALYPLMPNRMEVNRDKNGKRIHTSPYVPELAAGYKTVAFADFNYYWIGDRLGITFKRLNKRFAETGQIGFIASKRLDGKLILPEAIKVLQQNGTASSGT